MILGPFSLFGSKASINHWFYKHFRMRIPRRAKPALANAFSRFLRGLNFTNPHLGLPPSPSFFILHPSSYILHPSSFSLHPTSFILHPASFNLQPTSYIIHPISYILHPTSFILHPASFIPHPTSYVVISTPPTLCIGVPAFHYNMGGGWELCTQTCHC